MSQGLGTMPLAADLRWKLKGDASRRHFDRGRLQFFGPRGGGAGLVRHAGRIGQRGISQSGHGAGSGAGDVINVSAFFSGFADLISQSSQIGSDTIIALDGNDCLILENTLVSTLNEGDFQFA
ncbi:MAG: hypothetical protein HC794_04400 [Nitrospiraceae bacterium]|nr:hypothetical protein [Nitrospiraceae bacterium]